MWATTGVWTVWVSHPALNPPGHKSIPAARQTESDPALIILLPLFISECIRIRFGPPHSWLTASQLMTPLPQLTHSHSQLTHWRLCGPALTLSWVSIHSEIPGRNSAVQSVRRQHRDLLIPSVMWDAIGVQTHATMNVWVSRPALNPPCHNSTPATRQTELDTALTTAPDLNVFFFSLQPFLVTW